jgi:hypothetical protein
VETNDSEKLLWVSTLIDEGLKSQELIPDFDVHDLKVVTSQKSFPTHC